MVYDILANKKHARVVIDEGDGIIPSCILYLNIDTAGTFIRTFPILMDKTSVDQYLLEVKIAQVIGGTTKFTKLHRFRLSVPIIVEDQDLGEVLQVNCEHIAYQALRDNGVSFNEKLVAPRDRIDHLISVYNNFNLNGVIFGNVSITGIPNDVSLQRDYFPTSPQRLQDAFQEVLDRLKQPGATGGVFKNYYYGIEANAAQTNAFDVVFEEFGAQNSNVTINPTTNLQAALNDRQASTSNKKRHNVIVAKYHPRGGSLPMAHARFASNFAGAKFGRPEWVSNQVYAKDALVKYTHTTTTPFTIRFFKALNAVQSTTTPDADSVNWHEDFTTIPYFNGLAFYTVNEIVVVNDAGFIKHFRCILATQGGLSPPLNPTNWTQVFTTRPLSTRTDYITYTPYTTDIEAWKQNLANPTTPPSGYIGYAVDWNHERQINDLKDYTNRFLLITGKSVTRQTNTPPSGRELFNGQRILVSTAPTGAFVGHANQVAEYIKDLFVTTGWRFSDNPASGDTIFDWSTAKFKRWNGTSWVDAWDPVTNSDKPGPAHIVKSIRYIKGATQIPGQAIELRYNWLDLISGGDDKNRTSRGAWISFVYPYPRLDATGANIGLYYGGDGTNAPNQPQVDHQNLNKSSKGNPGWNRGQESEDLGRISAHACKLKVGFFASTDESIKIYGKSNITCVYWRKDLAGRFFFKDFVIPQNDEWFPVTIPLPPFGPTNLYFNRLDELVQIFGYTLPVQLPLQEREYTGVQYEWRENQSWGVFVKETYQENGFYTGCYQSFFDRFGQALTQLAATTILGFNALATGNFNGFLNLLANKTIVDHCNIAIDELHYVKEGYAVFPATLEPNAKSDFIHIEEETDYNTAFTKANAEFIEDQFFPQERFIGCTGNADIKYGKLITETGTRVPGGSLQSVIAKNKITVDNRGFNHELFLVRKFTI